jgi:AraC-like DNA-binding protein
MAAKGQVVITLIGEAAGRARITAILRELTGSPCICLTQAEVREHLKAGGIRGFLVAPYDRDGRSTVELVAEVRRDFPNVFVVAYGEVGRTSSAALVALIRAGAHDLLQYPSDDSRVAVETLLRTAHRTNVAAQVYDAVAVAVPPIARPLIQLYLRGAEGPVPVAEAAVQLGVNRKTLRNRMDAAGLPAPADLRAWCRLFLAAKLLDDLGRTVESVAHELDFSSGSALRNLLRRRTGLAPYELRAVGGVAYLLGKFLEECSARRAGTIRTSEMCEAGAVEGEQEVGTRAVALPRVAEPHVKGPKRSAGERQVRNVDSPRIL